MDGVGRRFYRLAEGQKRFIDVLAGVRYWSVETDLTLRAGLAPERKVSNSEDWFDPMIGLKGMSVLGKSKFFVTGGFALGGFGVGSDLFWDASINLGYQWTKDLPRHWATATWMSIMRTAAFFTTLPRMASPWACPGDFSPNIS
jgi:hypothetical protein